MFFTDRFEVFRVSGLNLLCCLAHKYGEICGQLDNLSNVVAMIVGNQQCALADVSISQSVNFKLLFRNRRAWQLFAIIDKQPPAIVLVFSDAAAYLVCTAMDGDSHSKVICKS